MILPTAGVTVNYSLPCSKWANPSRLRSDASREEREEVIRKYERHLVDSGLINDIHQLRGKDWCAGAPRFPAMAMSCCDWRTRRPWLASGGGSTYRKSGLRSETGYRPRPPVGLGLAAATLGAAVAWAAPSGAAVASAPSWDRALRGRSAAGRGAGRGGTCR